VAEVIFELRVRKGITRPVNGKVGSRVGSAEDALVERYGATDCFGQLGEGPRWSAVLKHDRLQRVELGRLTSANCRHSRVPSSFLHSSHSRERKPNPNDDGLWIERLRQGNLFPFALNASPNDVSLPPPVALSWHCPQAFPVSVANLAVASAGREIIRQAVPAIKINAAVLKTRTRAFLAFTFIVVSGLLMRLVQLPQTKPNPCQQMFAQLTSKMGPRPKRRLCGIE